MTLADSLFSCSFSFIIIALSLSSARGVPPVDDASDDDEAGAGSVGKFMSMLSRAERRASHAS